MEWVVGWKGKGVWREIVQQRHLDCFLFFASQVDTGICVPDF